MPRSHNGLLPDGVEILGSLARLGLNVAGMVIAGSLLLVRTTWPWLVAHSEMNFGSGQAGAR